MKRTIIEDVEEESNVNLTPLIDIVFVILMAFMITMPLIRLDSITLAPGTEKHEALEKDETSTTVIKVFADCTISLNDQILSLRELKTQLTLLHQQYPQRIPLLLQDGNTPFKVYQEVKAIVESAGFHELHIALKS
ncbi:hypothetical protein BOKEGFJH_00731 [Chlamydia avium]|nr:biopolymer transporter ExbD [Chlamydia avium]EPP36188.1 biopolymer transport ExbD/TolR family protein [Chlamydia psittaci 10_743_SC13]EPP38504.1 biopolymer transport ExbD/TolR family protein [Chlamydia avium]VVT43196.1 hypothetical protein BOKEGFJH_00731 [Chlamydia avium]